MPEQLRGMVVTGTNNESSSTIYDRRVAIIDTSSENGIKLPSGANSVETLYGVTLMDIPITITGALALDGIAYIEVSAAVSIGDVLVVGDAAGRVRPKAAGATAQGLAIVGYALRAATASGDEIPVRLVLQNEHVS